MPSGSGRAPRRRPDLMHIAIAPSSVVNGVWTLFLTAVVDALRGVRLDAETWIGAVLPFGT